jgi:hypothetical protein
VSDVPSTYKGKLRKKKGDSLYAPQETPCTLPQEKQDERCVIANAHSECVTTIVLLLFLQKQSLAFAVYLFGIGTLHTGPGLKKKHM